MASAGVQENRKRKRNTSGRDIGSHQRHAKKIKSEKTAHSRLKGNSKDSAISPRFATTVRPTEDSNDSNKQTLKPTNTNANPNETSKLKQKRKKIKPGDKTTPDTQNGPTKQNHKKQGKRREVADKTTLTAQLASKLPESDGAVAVQSKEMSRRKGSVWDVSSPSGGRFLDIDPLITKDEKYIHPFFRCCYEPYKLQISSSCHRKGAESLLDRDIIVDSNFHRFSI